MELSTLLRDETLRRQRVPDLRAKDLSRPRRGQPAAARGGGRAGRLRPRRGHAGPDDYTVALKQIRSARETCARWLPGSTPDEIALLGPTSLGLSLFAGDSTGSRATRSFTTRTITRRTFIRGPISRGAASSRARCNRNARRDHARAGGVGADPAHAARGAGVGVFRHRLPHRRGRHRKDARGTRACCFRWTRSRRSERSRLPVEHVDFLSADAHKWMLGPLASGIVYVKKSRFESPASDPAGRERTSVRRISSRSRKSGFSTPPRATSRAC